MIDPNRFRIETYRDGRHVTCILFDMAPPDLQPSNELCRWVMIDEQRDDLQAAIEKGNFVWYHRLGAPLPIGNEL